MPKPLKLLVKNLKAFVRTERVLFASNQNIKLYVSLRAGPNVKRYIVMHTHGTVEFFSKAEDAVRRFNEK